MVRVDHDAEAMQSAGEVWEQVLDELRVQIVLGEIPGGARLVENDLARQFGVSRGPIRTALMTLEQIGLVTASARRGLEVTRFTVDDIAHLYEVRAALEMLAAREAAPRVTPSTLDRLSGLHRAVMEHHAAGSPIDAAEADLAFHEEVCVTAANPVLLAAWSQLADRLATVMVRTLHDPKVAAPKGGSHADLIAALGAADPERAQAIVCVHITHAAERARGSGRWPDT
jgi:DNA-binding GntR family transcriptional regulator